MRIVLAMSGGVDSSASARLLQNQGHEVIGLFMRSGATAQATTCATVTRESPDSESPVSNTKHVTPAPLPVVNRNSHKQGCCSAADAADARRVADSLNIPFHALNFQVAFGRIKDYFADEYLAGRTPNPCVMCNNWLKFGRLWEFAGQVGAERIATGHYARIEPSAEFSPPLPAAPTSAADRKPSVTRPALLRGNDRGKDQSYVLFGIRRELLNKIVFPVGGHTKPAIRELARQGGLRVADKPDSQEICFVPDNDYRGFIDGYRGRQETAGELVDTAGNVIGRHEGFERFTVGQRKGLGVTFGAPRFVVAIQPDTRRVVIGTREDLACSKLEAGRLNWLADDPPPRFSCLVQIRYRHTAAAAEVHVVDHNRMRVRFAEPQYGVAPGQAVVCYDGDRVLGGGWIC